MVNFAQYGLIIIFSLFLIFHILILSKIIPYNIVWGNRLKSNKEMYRFEIISILVNLLFLFTILVHSKIMSFDLPKVALTIMFWIMAILFALNTLGNIVSRNKLEQRLFTIITIIMTILSLILAITNS